MILSVIFTYVMVTGNRDHHTFQCSNLLVTVRHIEGHIDKVAIVVVKLI